MSGVSRSRRPRDARRALSRGLGQDYDDASSSVSDTENDHFEKSGKLWLFGRRKIAPAASQPYAEVVMVAKIPIVLLARDVVELPTTISAMARPDPERAHVLHVLRYQSADPKKPRATYASAESLRCGEQFGAFSADELSSRERTNRALQTNINVLFGDVRIQTARRSSDPSEVRFLNDEWTVPKFAPISAKDAARTSANLVRLEESHVPNRQHVRSTGYLLSNVQYFRAARTHIFQGQKIESKYYLAVRLLQYEEMYGVLPVAPAPDESPQPAPNAVYTQPDAVPGDRGEYAPVATYRGD